MKIQKPLFLITFSLGLLLCWVTVSMAESKNGFNLDNSSIDIDKIHHGGPAKDGIPALDAPRFISPGKADFLEDDDRILGLAGDTEAKAYPVKILNWHEVVNDRLDDTPVVVTYCPLCGSGVAFDASVAGEVLDFGVSGLLYNSDVLLYDRQSESLWSQLLGRGITGAYKGVRLQRLPLVHTSWKSWRQQHPDTMVLSTKTGFERNYARDPYRGYATSQRLFFPVEHMVDGDIDRKVVVLGLSLDGAHKAYPFSALEQLGKASFADRLGSQEVTILWDEKGRSARALDTNGNELTTVQAFWFAWYTFHPQTEVFSVTE